MSLPHAISHKDIHTDTLGYSIWLTTFDDGTMVFGIGSAKRRQQAILSKDQVHNLTRTLQSMQTEL